MIKNIIDLLNINDWYGVSENIDIAKGKYRAVRNWNELKKQLKRQYHGK
ncbi:MAG: hypothetical protein Unbinned5089contig1000_14 [Prokaryotic dsDNA virus sp.]|mgnify:CR=1 FL=1|nr:MAG: hypothetical protein Unbinned5089contig1000_14 [Prokaryotic dsDNA virus sp.]|tara:strand:+ start:6898 stop:7044 length:147 start_codon:yes stop_codon:yes gene_type:complete